MGRSKLHIGCGKRNFGTGWYHIDRGEYPHVNWRDAAPLPQYKETVDLIYSSHMLEYFSLEAAREVILPEWYRVLKYGGILRLAVPDFEAMARLYTERKFGLESFIGPLFGRMQIDEDPDGVWSYHKVVYDFEMLSSLLVSCGFRNVRRWDWRKTEHTQFDDCSQAYLPKMDKINGTLISLNVEAEK